MSESAIVDMSMTGGSVAPVGMPVTTVAAHNPRARRLRSVVWNDFTKERRVDGSYVAICNHCKKQLTASSRSGTTHLKNHLNVCLTTKRVGSSRRRKLVVRRMLKQTDGISDEKGDEMVPFNQDVSSHDLARMIVRHGYRFSMVNDIGFQTFTRNLQPQFRMVSYDAIKAECMRVYEVEKNKMHAFLAVLPSRISLSVDMWRSTVGVDYLCLSCHFIEPYNEWKLRKKVLNFVQVDAPVTTEVITRIIWEKLHEWGVLKKLASIVLDNCCESDLVGADLLRSLQMKGIAVLNSNTFHVRTFAHILNLIVQDTFEIAHELINRVRATIAHVKISNERFLRFQEISKQAGILQKPLVLDDSDSWVSVYAMLESACQYQDIFLQCLEWDNEHNDLLSPNDWTVVKALLECLDLIYHTMEKLPAVEKPTANLYFIEICEVHVVLRRLLTRPYPVVVSSMASQMLEKFEQYWELSKIVMAFASILDPRYKMRSIEYYFGIIYTDERDEAKEEIGGIRNCFVSLYNEYAVQLAESSKSQSVVFYYGSGTTSTDFENSAGCQTFSRVTLSDARRGLDQYLQETSSRQTLKSDLDLYFEEAVYFPKANPPDRFDILTWWKTYAAKYPVLSVMAHDILAIPVSVVPLGTGARTLNDYLSTMDPVTVQGLICAQDWLRGEEDEVNPVNNPCIIPTGPVLDRHAEDSLLSATVDL